MWADGVSAAVNRPSAQLLVWYDAAGRDLPWRAKGSVPDPYRVWLSEIMLQQTTVATVIPYFERFVARWPSLAALAAAPLADVLHAWQGLGYYGRAHRLHACAKELAAHHGGRFPGDEAALRALPGIGPYTAAAIAAIAFSRPANVVDGNVERVIARLRGIDEPLPAARRRLRALAAELAPRSRPGDYAQALMDLGATVCTPRRPLCTACPWGAACLGRAQGVAETLPKRSPRRERPTRRGVAFWAVRADGAVLLRRRPPKGLLGGMMEVPSTPWREAAWSHAEARRHAPLRACWRALDGLVDHGFTHFRLELRVLAAAVTEGAADGLWCPLDGLEGVALPTLMKKVIAHARADAP